MMSTSMGNGFDDSSSSFTQQHGQSTVPQYSDRSRTAIGGAPAHAENYSTLGKEYASIWSEQAKSPTDKWDTDVGTSSYGENLVNTGSAPQGTC